MTEQFSVSQPFNQNYQNNVYTGNFNSQPSIFSGVINSAALGFAGGAAATAGIDYIKNRKPVKNGEVSDSFAKQVFNKIVDKGYTYKNKKFFKEKNELLKQLDKIKSPEKFTEIMKKYKNYASTLCDGISLESMCKTVNKDNLKGKISALKKRIEISLEPEIRNVKDTISLCWNENENKFIKPKEVEERIFKAIKNTKNSIQWKKMLKYGGITAGIFSSVSLIFSMISNKNQTYSNINMNNQYNY